MPHPIGLYTRPAAAAGGGGFDPSTLANLVQWYDASSAGTITGSPGVSQWNDRSSSALNLTQGTAGSQLQTGGATQNSLNVLTNDGARWMENASASSKRVTETIVAVIKTGSSFASNPFILAGCRGQRGYRILSSGKQDMVRPAVSDDGQSTTALSTSTVYIVGLTIDATSGMTFWLNGATDGTTALSFGTYSNTDCFYLNATTDNTNGSNSNIGSQWNGSMMELVIYSDVKNSTDMGTIFTGLNGKWAVY